MGSYVESNLIKGEKIQYEGKTSIWLLFPRMFVGILVLVASVFIWQMFLKDKIPAWWLLPVAGIALLYLLPVAITYYTTELVITNKRIIAKFGLIRRDTMEMNIVKVESIQVDQSIPGRIFNFGSILISGAGDPKTAIPAISRPLRFRKVFFEVQELVLQEHKEQAENL